MRGHSSLVDAPEGAMNWRIIASLLPYLSEFRGPPAFCLICRNSAAVCSLRWA